ncbi:MAG: RNA methyltransferase [Bacilli bacterium]|jgi:RNA methyltransferase, TrmH family
MIQYITSRKNQIVQKTISLRNNKKSQEEKKFVIEGEHLFEMAIKANNICYIITTKHINNVDENIDQYIVTKDIIEKISTSKSAPDVIAVCNYINDSIKLSNNLIYLDNIQDPGNLGTILRSALAFSNFDILISNDSVNKYNDKAIQASQGAIFNLNIENSDIDKLKKLKTQGYKIVVSILSKDAIKLDDFKFDTNEKYVFVFGNEGQGIKKEIIDLADYKVFIEMSNIDSLNVGVAASIILYKAHLNK